MQWKLSLGRFINSQDHLPHLTGVFKEVSPLLMLPLLIIDGYRSLIKAQMLPTAMTQQAWSHPWFVGFRQLSLTPSQALIPMRRLDVVSITIWQGACSAQWIIIGRTTSNLTLSFLHQEWLIYTFQAAGRHPRFPSRFSSDHRFLAGISVRGRKVQFTETNWRTVPECSFVKSTWATLLVLSISNLNAHRHSNIYLHPTSALKTDIVQKPLPQFKKPRKRDERRTHHHVASRLGMQTINPHAIAYVAVQVPFTASW